MNKTKENVNVNYLNAETTSDLDNLCAYATYTADALCELLSYLKENNIFDENLGICAVEGQQEYYRNLSELFTGLYLFSSKLKLSFPEIREGWTEKDLYKLIQASQKKMIRIEEDRDKSCSNNNYEE